jgi:hypothetical protein
MRAWRSKTPSGIPPDVIKSTNRVERKPMAPKMRWKTPKMMDEVGRFVAMTGLLSRKGARGEEAL